MNAGSSPYWLGSSPYWLGSSPYWLSFAVKYERGPGDIQSVMIRQVSNKQTPATTRRKCPLQFFCKFFL
jgi:hypothetical protein